MHPSLHHILELTSTLGFIYADQVCSLRRLCRLFCIHPIPIAGPEVHARVHSDRGCHALAYHLASNIVLHVDAKWITSKGVRSLSKLHLSTLDLGWCHTLPECSLHQLPRTLTHLTLTHCPLISTLPRSFASHLKILRIRNCYDITEPHRFLPEYNLLQELEISSFRASDAWILALPSSPHLTTLSIKYSQCLTDHGLQHLVFISKLTSLDLTRCTQITQASFPYIALLPLRKLVLNGCSLVDDRVLAYVSTMATLRELHIRKCNRITAEGLIKLNRNFDEFRIVISQRQFSTVNTIALRSAATRIVFIEQNEHDSDPIDAIACLCFFLVAAAVFIVYCVAPVYN